MKNEFLFIIRMLFFKSMIYYFFIFHYRYICKTEFHNKQIFENLNFILLFITQFFLLIIKYGKI